MPAERYAFLPDMIFVLVGAYLATLHMFPPPPGAVLPDSGGASVKMTERSETASMHFIPPAKVPVDAVMLLVSLSSEGTRFAIAGREDLDETALRAVLVRLREGGTSAIRIESSGEHVPWGVVAQASGLCTQLGLSPYVTSSELEPGP